MGAKVSKKENMGPIPTKSPKVSKEILFSLVVFGIVVLVIAYNSGKEAVIERDFTSLKFVIPALIVVFLTFWGIYSDDEKINKSARHAFTAFMIAYLARLDMVFSAFVLVWLFVYYAPVGHEWV